MPWVRIDDGFYMHPKARAVGKDGRALYIASLCWAGSNLTDGFVPTASLPLLAASAEVTGKIARQLVDAGLWDETTGGWQIHDYLDYQPSRAEVEANREMKARAGRAGGIASGISRRSRDEAAASGSASGLVEANGEADGKQKRTTSHPIPSHPPSLLTSPSFSSSRATVDGEEEAVDNSVGGDGRDRVAAIAEAVANHRASKRNDIDRPTAWVARVKRQLLDDDLPRFTQLAHDYQPDTPLSLLVAHYEGEPSGIGMWHRDTEETP